MKRTQFMILILIVASLLGVAFLNLYLVPKISDDNPDNAVNDTNALTQDFGSMLKYRTKYMGDNSGVININNNLPLSDIQKTFSLHPETFTVEINYNVNASSIKEKKLEQAIIYNATANFVLVDNLSSIKLNFKDISYSVSRTSLEKWYGNKLSKFQNKDKFKKEVQSKLSNQTYLDKFMAEATTKTEKS